MGNHLSKNNVENSEPHRRFYRNMLIETPGMENHISGIIMFEETLD